jgi:hypothetical protein
LAANGNGWGNHVDFGGLGRKPSGVSMKYQVNTPGFVINQFCIPTGTIIDQTIGNAMSYMSRVAIGFVPPSNAYPLDQEAYNVMRTKYNDRDIAQVGPGIVRTPDLQ